MSMKKIISVILTFVLLIGTNSVMPATQISAKGKAKINAKSYNLNPGAKRTLTVSGVSGKVKWSTSNKKIVSIKKKGNKAIVTAKKKGTATITAKTGKISFKCKIKVSGKKVLIVYFSRTGNNRKIAKYINKRIGGDVIQITPKKAYPSNYSKCVAQAEKELENDIRPEITTKVKNFEQYDEVVICFPIWLAYHNLIQCTQA